MPFSIKNVYLQKSYEIKMQKSSIMKVRIDNLKKYLKK